MITVCCTEGSAPGRAPAPGTRWSWMRWRTQI